MDHENKQEAVKVPTHDELLKTIETLKDLLQAHTNKIARYSPEVAEAETNFGRVRRYFETTGNQPASTAQIRVVTGISRGSLSNLLYLTHAAFFESSESEEHKRRKLWWLRTAGPVRDMVGMAAHTCCRRILLEHKNEPLHILTMAKEAIRRGYRGRGKYEGDAMEWVTAKSFWARLSRSNKHDFEQVKPNVFKLKNPDKVPDQSQLFDDSENEIEEEEESENPAG